MISIRIGNQYLELPEDFVFSHTRKSPLYLGGDMDTIPGAYSLPTKISASSPINRRLIGYPEFISNWEAFSKRIEASVYIDGNLFSNGKLHIKLADPSEYQLQFFSSAGDLSSFKSKTLQDFNLGGSFTIDGPDPQGFAFNFLVHEGLTQTQPGYDHVIYYSRLYSERFESYSFMYTLSLYVKDILAYIFEEEGYQLEMDLFDNDPELASLVLYHPKWFYQATPTQTSLTIQKNQHVPKMTVANFLKSLAKNFCLGYDIDSRQRIVRLFRHKDLLQNSQVIDWSSRVAGPFKKKQSNFSIKQLLYKTDDPILDKHEPGKNLFNYRLLDPVPTINDLPVGTPGDACYVYAEAAYARFDEQWDIDNLFQSMVGITVDTSGSKIESNLSTLFTSSAEFNTHYPKTDHLIIYESNDETPSQELGQLLFYRGRIANDVGTEVALASGENLKWDGDLLGDYSLKWYGEYGLFEQHWKQWVDFLKTASEVEVTIQPKMIDLFTLGFGTPFLLYDAHSGGHNRYFLKEFKMVVDMKGIKRATQTFIPIRP